MNTWNRYDIIPTAVQQYMEDSMLWTPLCVFVNTGKILAMV